MEHKAGDWQKRNIGSFLFFYDTGYTFLTCYLLRKKNYNEFNLSEITIVGYSKPKIVLNTTWLKNKIINSAQIEHREKEEIYIMEGFNVEKTGN